MGMTISLPGRNPIAKWKVWVCLECEYDDIEAETEEETFHIASDYAMGGGSWDYFVEKMEESNG